MRLDQSRAGENIAWIIATNIGRPRNPSPTPSGFFPFAATFVRPRAVAGLARVFFFFFFYFFIVSIMAALKVKALEGFLGYGIYWTLN